MFNSSFSVVILGGKKNKSQRLAIGSQGSWSKDNDGVTLHLRQFACTPGATRRDHDFFLMKPDKYKGGVRTLRNSPFRWEHQLVTDRPKLHKAAMADGRVPSEAGDSRFPWLVHVRA